MSISTDNEKLAVIEWCHVWEPALPISPGTLEIDDKQQLLWGYPGVRWITPLLDVEVIDRQLYAVTLSSIVLTSIELTESLPNGVSVTDEVLYNIAITNTSRTT